MATGIGQARYSFSTILYVTPQKSLESFEGDCRFRLDDGQVGSNAVNLEHKASKVFSTEVPQILRRCPGEAHRSSDLFFASSSLGPLFPPLQ
jgi:hypothetical protein